MAFPVTCIREQSFWYAVFLCDSVDDPVLLTYLRGVAIDLSGSLIHNLLTGDGYRKCIEHNCHHRDDETTGN